MENANLSAPRFAKGDHVTVDPRSELAYETYTRHGAVGVIMIAGKKVGGIRRYSVLFEVPHLGGRRASRIREEHLLPAEASAPPPTTTLRHAYEYRDEKQRKGQRLWCDAGGCFIEDCAVCRAYLGDALRVTREDGETHVTVFASARGGRVTCQHDWQTWGADGRYRLCRKCKRAERVLSASQGGHADA